MSMRRRAAVQDAVVTHTGNTDANNEVVAHEASPSAVSPSASGQHLSSSVQVPFGSSTSIQATTNGIGRKRPRKSPLSTCPTRIGNFASSLLLWHRHQNQNQHERIKCLGVIYVLGIGLLLAVAFMGMLGEIYYPVGQKGGNIVSNHDEKGATYRPKPPQIYAVGLVRDMAEIQPDVLRWLAEVNCNHGVGLHIVAGGGAGDAATQKDSLDHYRSRIVDEQSRIPTKEPAVGEVGEKSSNAHTKNNQGEMFSGCAPAHIVTEDADVIYGTNKPRPTNRIERIAALRDYQRELLRTQYVGDDNANGISDGAVIVIDLDLAALPPPQRVVEVAHKLSCSEDGMSGSGSNINSNSPPFPFDAICAAGVTAASKRELWYYDTYATVLWPDTYLHPLQRRLIKKYYPGEDPALVRSNDRNGNWTQGDIMRYLQTKAKEQSEHGTVDARSCFGGMTIYRASAWFEPKCSYAHGIGIDRGIGGSGPSSNANGAAASTGLMRYASEADGRPCEHVVFHDCLIRTNEHGSIASDSGVGDSKSRIAIMPKLLTLWRKDKKK